MNLCICKSRLFFTASQKESYESQFLTSSQRRTIFLLFVQTKSVNLYKPNSVEHDSFLLKCGNIFYEINIMYRIKSYVCI